MELKYRSYPSTPWVDSRATKACCPTMEEFMHPCDAESPRFSNFGISGSPGSFLRPFMVCPWCAETIDYDDAEALRAP